MSIKFVLSKTAVVVFVVNVPFLFLVLFGHGYRLFFTEHEHRFYICSKNGHQIPE